MDGQQRVLLSLTEEETESDSETEVKEPVASRPQSSMAFQQQKQTKVCALHLPLVISLSGLKEVILPLMTCTIVFD